MTVLTTIPNGASFKDIRDTFNALLADVASLKAGAVSPPTTPTVSLSSAVSKAEGNSGSTLYTYTVSRSTTSGAVNVPWSFAAGPTSAADFVGGVFPGGGTVALADGVASGTFSVFVAGDTAVEPDETFTVSITVPTGYGGSGSLSATGTILNDDAATGGVTIDPAVTRSGNSYTFTARRTTNLANAESRNITVGPSTDYPPGALASDFPGSAFPTATANFAAGSATAPITIVASATAQPE